MCAKNNREITVDVIITEYRELRSELIEFQKIIYRGTVLYLTVCMIGLSTTINLYYSGYDIKSIYESDIILSIISIIPAISTLFWFIMTVYVIQILGVSLYLSDLGDKLSDIISYDGVLFGWERIGGRQSIVHLTEITSFSLLSSFAFALNILILYILFMETSVTLSSVPFTVSLFSTCIFIFVFIYLLWYFLNLSKLLK
jgi:hypothetical protein